MPRAALQSRPRRPKLDRPQDHNELREQESPPPQVIKRNDGGSDESADEHGCSQKDHEGQLFTRELLHPTVASKHDQRNQKEEAELEEVVDRQKCRIHHLYQPLTPRVTRPHQDLRRQERSYREGEKATPCLAASRRRSSAALRKQ